MERRLQGENCKIICFWHASKISALEVDNFVISILQHLTCMQQILIAHSIFHAHVSITERLKSLKSNLIKLDKKKVLH